MGMGKFPCDPMDQVGTPRSIDEHAAIAVLVSWPRPFQATGVGTTESQVQALRERQEPRLLHRIAMHPPPHVVHAAPPTRSLRLFASGDRTDNLSHVGPPTQV